PSSIITSILTTGRLRTSIASRFGCPSSHHPRRSRYMAPVLIIGATSSVASNVARILAARGRALVLVARDENKLRQLTSELGTSVLGTRLLDFAHHEEIEPLVHSLYEEFQEFDLALLAHGYLGNQLKS